jgi:hypothetical protein
VPVTSVERKVISGLRSTSKNSGESRCGRMSSSSIEIESTVTPPSRLTPSSVETSLASIGLKPPRKVETPACSTSKVALE